MAHEVYRLIAEKINNKPLLITEESLTPIIEYLESRPSLAISNEDTKRRNAPSIAESVAMIQINGSLSYQKSWLGAMCGMTSYQQLLEDVEEVIDLGAKTLVLDISSGGGEAYAAFQTANSIKKMCNNSGVKLIAYVDGMAASAAYALACVADEVIAHPMAEVGSIGVLIRLIDQSKALANAGVKPIFITSAKSKVPFATDGSFKEDFLADLQAKVDTLHTEFVNHVANHRKMSVESINATNAKTFVAKDAKELGLIDSVMEHEEFFEYLAQLEDKNQVLNINSLFKTKAASPVTESAKLEDDEAMKLAELQAQYDELSASLATTAEQVTLLQNEVATAKLAIEEKDALLLAAQTELEEMKAAKAKAIADEKMAKLSAVYGDAEAADLFEAMAALPDDKFDKIVNAKRLDNQNLTQSTMFKEVGVETEASAPVVMTQEQLLEQRIKQQNQ